MAEENMARVKVTKTITIMPNQTSTVLYNQGWEGTAPHAHIEQIVNAGAGERVVERQQVAENADAFKSGSDNASV